MQHNINLDNNAFQRFYANELLRTRREIMPELVVTLKNGSLKKIDVSFGNDADKDLTILAIETYLRKKEATEYTIISETWIGSGFLDKRPSDSLYRDEGLAFTTWRADGTNTSSLWQIKSSESGSRYVDTIHESLENTTMTSGSIMANLFLPSQVKMTSTLKRKVDKLVLSFLKKEKTVKPNF